MKIFTIENGAVTEGAKVINYHLRSSGDITIPAITVGEEGRGRKVGVLPVQLSANYQQWQTEGHCWVYNAQLGQTKTGRPKLLALAELEPEEPADNIICVFRTQIGFRGGNAHTGDRVGWHCTTCGAVGPELDPPELCPNGHFVNIRFAEFPGTILVQGVIAQGTAGAMGSGKQIVAVMPPGKVFRTGYSGRLYGKPAAHYYLWDGFTLQVATWDERQVAELF